jgi:AraC family transcriptional regulator
MATIITPNELPKYVPGKILAASDDLGWNGVWLRAYRYTGLDVIVPPVRDFTIVSYCRGATFMERRADGAWTKTHCKPGDVSLLTRSQSSHWHWTEDIDVCHVYLTEHLISGICGEIMDRCVADVRLHDVLKTHDPAVATAVAAITREAQQQALGSTLYVEAVATQLAVHLVRNYASVTFREPSAKGRLSPAQVRRLTEYIDGRLHESPNLERSQQWLEWACGVSPGASENPLVELHTLTLSSVASIARGACWLKAACRSKRWHWLADLPIRLT